MKPPRLTFLLLLFLPRLLCAQAASPQSTPLSEPLLQKRAPDFASWSITHVPTGDPGRANTVKSAPHGPDTKTTVVKTSGLMLRSHTDNKGQVWNTWCSGKTQVTIYPNQKDTVVQDSAPEGTTIFYTDYSKSDFPDFDWVTQSSYVGTKTYKGRPCLVFHGHRDVETWVVIPLVTTEKKGGADKHAVFDPNATLSITAYIDAETRLPVALQDGDVIEEINFQPEPKEMLKFPDIVNQILNQRAANWRALTRTIHVQS